MTQLWLDNLDILLKHKVTLQNMVPLMRLKLNTHKTKGTLRNVQQPRHPLEHCFVRAIIRGTEKQGYSFSQQGTYRVFVDSMSLFQTHLCARCFFALDQNRGISTKQWHIREPWWQVLVSIVHVLHSLCFSGQEKPALGFCLPRLFLVKFKAQTHHHWAHLLLYVTLSYRDSYVVTSNLYGTWDVGTLGVTYFLKLP